MAVEDRVVTAKIITPDQQYYEETINLDDNNQYSQFVRGVLTSLQKELKFGFEITDSLKRKPNGTFRNRRELHNVLASMGADNRKFIDAVENPNEGTQLLIHTDTDGNPVAVSLPEEKIFESSIKSKRNRAKTTSS